MSSTTYAVPRRRPLWIALRSSQALFLLPLGTLQLAAVIAFTTTADELTRGELALAGWAAVMDVAGLAVAGLLPRRTFLVRRVAFGILRAQILFCLVKLIAYGELASLVFLALVGLTWLLLRVDQRRHPSFV